MSDSAEITANHDAAASEREAAPTNETSAVSRGSSGSSRVGRADSRGERRLPSTPGNLYTEQGQTTIADVVVTKVAGIAAREVGGVHALGGGVTRAFGAVAQRLPGSDPMTQGVSVEVGETEAAVDLTVVIDYGESIPRVAAAVRENIIRRIEGICGLAVKEVNIAVTDLYFPGDDDSQPSRRQLQ